MRLGVDVMGGGIIRQTGSMIAPLMFTFVVSIDGTMEAVPAVHLL